MNARIDVTELFGDPDFVGPIQQIVRTYRVDSYGQNVLGETCINTVGSVQPISGADLQKIPEALRVANMRTFFMKGTINFATPGKYLDLLVFEGRRYQILTVDDWAAWGQGWSQGACVAEMPAGGPA